MIMAVFWNVVAFSVVEIDLSLLFPSSGRLIAYDGVRLCLRTAATDGHIFHSLCDTSAWSAVVMMVQAGITPDSSIRAL
jgi:hypothetical protein